MCTVDQQVSKHAQARHLTKCSKAFTVQGALQSYMQMDMEHKIEIEWTKLSFEMASEGDDILLLVLLLFNMHIMAARAMSKEKLGDL